MKLQFIKSAIYDDYTEHTIHVAERAIEPNLPEWRKLPYCRNGGLNLYDWDFIELETTLLNADNVCGACKRRLKAKKINITWKDK